MKARIKQLSIATCLLVFPLAFANPEAKATNTNTKDASSTLDAKTEQVSNPNDEAVTRQIRSHLAQDERLSVYAKSIEIKSVDGQVSLSGKVPTKAERDLIGRHAAMVVNPSKIKNFIKVAPSGAAR